MILQALVNYYEILRGEDKVPEAGYSIAKVSYGLNISCEGELLNVIPLKRMAEVGKKKIEEPCLMKVPEQVTRSSGVSANFLCDNSSYLLGSDQKGKPKRSLECFEASKQLVTDVLNQCESSSARAVMNYFRKWNAEMVLGNPVLQDYIEDLLAGGNIVFFVEGEEVLKDRSIQSAWEMYHSGDKDENQMQCLITGKYAAIARLHPVIRGIPGAQSSGASLVSFNAVAYDSYGHENGTNAPASKEAVFAYTTVLNYLLSKRDHKQTVGDMTVVFWADSLKSEYCDAFSAGIGGDEDKQELIKRIFEKISIGQPVEDIDMGTEFYILGLSPNAARLSVRFFIKNSFGKILENLYRHQERLKIIKPLSKFENIPLYWLLRETVNLNSKDKSPTPLMAGAMLRAIIQGTPYPNSFYQGLILRAKAERNVTSGRAAGIKAYLMHNKDYQVNQEVLKVKVNEETNEKAYVLGRLFAVLERAQEEANKNINSTIKDKYFTSACANPGVVFPRLLQLAGYHNAKNEYGKAREYEIGKIISKLDVENEPFPSHLSLKEQGIFMLGYYQQREQRFEKKEDKQ